jgi:lipopolysaccharide transport system permease protein
MKTSIYIPDKSIKIGVLGQWKEMFINLFQSRELILRLFLRDFNAKYKQSLLGILWAIINPIIIVSVFVFLNKAGIIKIEEIKVPYPVFALIGVSIYGIFSTGLSTTATSIIGAGSMVVKINFPKISLVISSFLQSLVEFIVRLILLAIIFVIFGIFPQWETIFLPFLIIPIILLTLGIGFLFSLLTCVFRDMVYIVSLFTTFLLFLTPVLYPTPKNALFVKIDRLNPLSHLITACRDLILLGKISNYVEFLFSFIFSIIIFFIGWWIFHLSETKIAERV